MITFYCTRIEPCNFKLEGLIEITLKSVVYFVYNRCIPNFISFELGYTVTDSLKNQASNKSSARLRVYPAAY